MFLGNYQSNFDNQKGRTALPSVFRKQVGDKAIITKGYEKSLIIVKTDDWEKVINGVVQQSFLSGLSRQTDRFLLSNAFEIEFDIQGRFIVPVTLREYAQLNKSIVFAGVGSRIEVWNDKAWHENDIYLNENIAQISETLNDKLGTR